jgi:ESS family glutamate:Na+ symporter
MKGLFLPNISQKKQIIMTSLFESISSWTFLIQIFIITAAMLIGNIIRRKIGFMNRSLIPTALIGGLLIFLLKLIPSFNDLIDKNTMEIITYHTLALGFIAMSLRVKKETCVTSTTKVIETGVLTIGTYIVQALVGLVITVPLFLYCIDSEWFGNIFYAGGLLLPMGFGQGPGQALNFGSIYQEHAMASGLPFQGKDFGLSIAAIGFIVGSVVGVVYMNILRKKGKLTIVSDKQGIKTTMEDYETDNDIPHSESVDKLTITLSMIFVVYLFVYLFMMAMNSLHLGNLWENSIKPLIWGFNFFWGILFASLMKMIVKFLRKREIMHREYLNDYLLNRSSGFFFDIMIVAGTAAISFENLKSFIIPLLLVCLLGAIATFIYINWVCKELYKGYEYEAFFAMFGTLTGTASNGMILLREIDPKYETPAANNLVLQNIPAVVLGLPILLVLGYAPNSLQATYITIGIVSVLWIIATLFIFRKRIFKKFKK